MIVSILCGKLSEDGPLIAIQDGADKIVVCFFVKFVKFWNLLFNGLDEGEYLS